MNRVKTLSGLNGWQMPLRDNYDNNFEQFEHYSETYSLAERLGFQSATAAWQANPIIEGSTNPRDFRISPSETNS